MNKIRVVLTGMLICLGIVTMAQKQYVHVIPQPNHIKMGEGHFTVNEQTKIVMASKIDLQFEANYLSKLLENNIGSQVEIEELPTSASSKIVLKCKDDDGDSQAYQIKVSRDKVEISASNRTGVFYGIHTLFQLFPSQGSDLQNQLPCIEIKDKPRFPYRALMLDPARHFLPIDDIKRYVDVMAMYKFNYLHLHLSDDQGWRVEIKKYPKLTEIGSKRAETDGDGKPHSGFYTQEELKELVEYAAKRSINIIPEFDMPGHNVASVVSYPELTCFESDLEVRTTPGVSEDLLCAGNEKVYKFIDDVIGELVTIFPSEKFHVGGDEAPLTNWKKCPKCQNTVKGNDLKDMHGLMSYFFNRVNQSLVKYKKRPMFWYEYDVPNYPSNSFMYAWRGEIRDTLIQRMVDEGHQVICTPGIHTYFDYPQLKGEETCHWMPILNLERVYQFDPGYGLSSKYQKRIYGVEGTLWGEYIKDINRAFYMTWPRAMALSEAGWSEMDNRSWDSFKKRLYPQLERLMKWGINFRVPTEIGNSPMNK